MGSNAASANGSSASKSKTTLSKFSALINVIKGTGKMIKVGREKNKEIAANNSLLETSDYQGDVKPANFGRDNNDYLKGIKVAKTSTTSAKAIAPTTAEISQATATEADTTPTYNVETRKKKAKAKGRSITILSSSKGVTSDENLILGKKSLLGQ